MFVKKLIFIAAAVALAVTNVAAEEEATRIKIHLGKAVQHKQATEVNATAAPIAAVITSLEGSDEGEVGSDWESGSGSDESEEEEEDSESGSYDSEEDDSESGSDEEEISVVAVVIVDLEDSTSGSDDYSDSSDSSEPASTTTTTTTTTATTTAPAKPAGGVCSGPGESPMSVEGVEGIFCVKGQACVADINGACPGPQEGLARGAYCGTVKTGVLGCKPNTAQTLKHKKKYEEEAKKLSAKLQAAKKSHAKKSPVMKKSAAKKQAVKKTAVKKTAAKKTTVHKQAAKKTTSRKEHSKKH